MLTPTTKKSQKVLKSGKKVEISLVEGSFRRIAGVREEADFSGSFILRTVEIRREAGKSLGFYIREGDGWLRKDGVFVSRVNLGSLVDVNGLLHVGDEVLKINNVEVSSLSLDEVVLIMTLMRKLVLTIKVLTSVSLTRTLSSRMPRRRADNSSRVLPPRPRSISYAEKIASKESGERNSMMSERRTSAHTNENPYAEISSLDVPQISANLNFAQPTPTPRVTQCNSTSGVGSIEEIEMRPLESRESAMTASSPLAASTPVQPHKLQSSAQIEVHVDIEPTAESHPYEEVEFGALSPKKSVESTPPAHVLNSDKPSNLKGGDSDSDECPPPLPATPVPGMDDNERKKSLRSAEIESDARVDISAEASKVDKKPRPVTSTPPQSDKVETRERLKPEKVSTVSLRCEDEAPPPPVPSTPPPLEDNNAGTRQLQTGRESVTSLPPPPLPSTPPPLESHEGESSFQTEEEGINSREYDGEESTGILEEPDKSKDDHTCSGVLVATVRSLSVSGDREEGGHEPTPNIDKVEFTLFVDSVLKVRSVVNPTNMGSIESRTFCVDILENQQISITLKSDYFSKSRQVSLFSPTTEGSTRKFLLPFKLDKFGRAKINLEYRPMIIAVPRMDPNWYSDDIATLRDYVELNPSGSPLPLVVERCIRIIAQYGLQEPHLYHLCSSDAAKGEAFGVSSGQARSEREIKEILSRVSVHAFTGVLKDFFRKLPQPFFTNKLSTSLTEAASMENASQVGDFLMQFTRCLPEHTIPTYDLLMEHLRQVCDHGSENGMTVESLSRVFGPLLLTPSLFHDLNTSETTENFANDYKSQSRVITILMHCDRSDELPPTYKV